MFPVPRVSVYSIQSKNIVKCKLCAHESEENVSELITRETLNKVPGIFFYEGPESFASDALLSRDFRNLKIHLKRHVSKVNHQDKLKEQMNEAEDFIKSDYKNKEAALRCARICLRGCS